MRAAVLGCGYVGLALGRLLREAGHDVTGVRRSDAGLRAVEDAGLRAVRADVTDADALADVPDADWLVFAASSGGRSAAAAREVYVDGLETTAEAFAARANPPERLVYTSSTGVYGDHGGDWVDETTALDPATERTRVLVEAEERARDAPFDATVARFAGLYGPERYRLDRYLDGPVTEGWLNLVHRADAAGAVAHLLTTDRAREETVLVVDDEPVWRPTFAAWLADECGRDPPATRTVADRIDDDVSETAARRVRANKRCSNDRLHGYGYEFTHPTFRAGYRDAVDAHRG